WEWLQFGPFAFQPGFTLVYVTYFFAGVGIGVHGFERGLLAPDGMLARRWAAWLAGAAGGFLLWIIPTALTMDRQGWYVPALEILADFALLLSWATTSAVCRIPIGARLMRAQGMLARAR